MWRYVNTEELYHHGVRGQKWGIRRYQNKDGSLTPAGRRRADKLKDEYTQLTGKQMRRKPDKKEDVKETSNKKVNLKKQISEMSDAELKDRYNRLNTEKQVMQLEKERASTGQKFVTTVGKDVIKPSLIEAGKRIATDYLTKIGKEALGLEGNNDKDSKLKKEVADLELKKRKIQAQEWLDNNEKLKNRPLEDDLLDMIENGKNYKKKK